MDKRITMWLLLLLIAGCRQAPPEPTALAPAAQERFTAPEPSLPEPAAPQQLPDHLPPWALQEMPAPEAFHAGRLLTLAQAGGQPLARDALLPHWTEMVQTDGACYRLRETPVLLARRAGKIVRLGRVADFHDDLAAAPEAASQVEQALYEQAEAEEAVAVRRRLGGLEVCGPIPWQESCTQCHGGASGLAGAFLYRFAEEPDD